LDAAVDIVRKVITELRPSVLDQLGVWAALEWYAEQVELRTGIKCVITMDDQVLETQIDTERSTALFRILQESLTNVTRHAEASKVNIRVARDHGAITMEVEDNGNGIDLTRLPGHQSWGITGMVERARFFGGNLEIKDISPGTLVIVRLPLEHKNG
jgi:signal transduction histidine kinase